MPKHPIQLSDHFTDSRLIRFVLPCIGTMLFTSIYGIVDGLCVSNFVGKTAFAAVNLIMPLPMLIGSIGFMLGTGGSAIVGITLGEGDNAKADRYFSLFMSTALIAGIVLSVLGMLLLRPVAMMLGAEGEMLDYALRYGRVLMLSLPTFILQNMFQSFFVTAEKPHLGFYFTVGAGCTNMVLDVVLVGVLRWGVEGAAVATFLSQIVGGLLPVFYFLDRNNTSRLHLSRTKFHGHVLRNACINGSSELMTNLSMSLVNILYNYQLLRFAGEDGVAAFSIACYFFPIIFMVYNAIGQSAQPILSYNFGAGNGARVRKAFRLALLTAVAAGLGFFGLTALFSRWIVAMFIDSSCPACAIAVRGLPLFASGFVFFAVNIVSIGYFQSVERPRPAMAVTVLRGFVFMAACFFGLPLLLGVEGIWLAVPLAEALTFAVVAAIYGRTRLKSAF